jgi:photosystem II stability/assembly factor-like uncharacterized protein
VTPPDPFSGTPDEWGTALDFLNQDTGWLAVETGKGPTFTITVERTTNGGSSWQASTITTGSIPGGLDLDFTGPRDGWLLAMSTPAAGLMSKAIYSTSDGGRTWEEVSCSGGPGCSQKTGGLPGDSYPTGIAFLGSDGFVSASYHGDPYLWFYGSQDAGHTWQRIPLAVPKADAQGYGDVYLPSFFGTSGRMFVQFTNPTGPALVVYQSSHGGHTWQPNASPALPISWAGQSAQFGWTSGEDGWVASGDGKELFRTTDGGQTWTRTPLPSAAAAAASEGVLQIAFTSAQDGLLAASDSGMCSLFTTHDGGKTWTPVAGKVASAN